MSLINKLKQNMPKYLFIFSISIIIFIYGFFSGKNRIFPYYVIDYYYNEIINFVKSNKPHQLWPIRYQQSGVTILDEDRAMPGYTFITSYWPESDWIAGLQLIDLKGNVLHQWVANPREVWPDSPHDDIARNTKNKSNNGIHGSFLYPNGDVIFNIEFLGLVRMNSRNEIIWKLPYRTHHSVFQDEVGDFWVSGAKWLDENDDRIKDFPGMNTPFLEETLIKVSPEGEILKEISLLEAFYNANYQHLLHNYYMTHGDLFHLNDVEVLKEEFDSYDSFNKGDLLISSRHLNLIAILNQAGHVKWINSNKFTKQHDPDFESDGWVTVFDNRSGIGRSQIRTINPETNITKTIFPTNDEQKFYTEHGGKHQKLINGNRLITEAMAGRVFEISPQGDIVWEWIQKPYNEKLVPEVLEGTRYYLDKEDII